MVIRCSHCKGLMRIDESVLPTGRSVRARCPHCSEIGPIHDTVSVIPADDRGPDQSTQSPDQTIAADLRAERPAGKPAFPSGITSEYRFPAEQASVSSGKRMLGPALKIALWAIVALLVVVLFALLVNIILPGPYGGDSNKGLPPHDEAATRTVEKVRPSQWGKDAGRSPAKR